jgi:hypothetical protein
MDNSPKEFRCTRNKPYNNPECVGYNNPPGREGHYIVARTKEGALQEMHRTFPYDGQHVPLAWLFTADVWKTGANVPPVIPVEDVHKI